MGTSKTRGEQGSTTSLKAAVQLGHWLRALIYNNNKRDTVYIEYMSAETDAVSRIIIPVIILKEERS
jgi:hypothetical protein